MKERKTCTGECSHLNLHLDAHLAQCLLCGLLGLHLSGLLCTLRLFFLGSVPLIFDHRVGNIAGASLDWLMGLVLLAVQISPCCCCYACHNGAVCIAGVIICLQHCDYLLHQVQLHSQLIVFPQQLLYRWRLRCEGGIKGERNQEGGQQPWAKTNIHHLSCLRMCMVGRHTQHIRACVIGGGAEWSWRPGCT